MTLQNFQRYLPFFDDQIVWITGASSGIGRELAIQLSSFGTRLILSSRNSEELEMVRENCINPDNHTILPMDLSDETSISNSVEKAVSVGGKIDFLINNAGVSQKSLAIDTKMEVTRYLMQVNFFGPAQLTKSLLPQMIERRKGHVISVSSLVGKFGTPYRSSYAAAKHALIGYMDSLRAEVAKHGIRVQVFCPGYVESNITSNALDGNGKPLNELSAPKRKIFSAHECARQMIENMAGKKDEVLIGGFEVYGSHLKRFMPQTFNQIIRHVSVMR